MKKSLFFLSLAFLFSGGLLGMEVNRKDTQSPPYKRVKEDTNPFAILAKPQNQPSLPENQPSLEDYIRGLNSTHPTNEYDALPDINYHERVVRWFKPSFQKKQTRDEVIYHCFPQLVDKIVLNIGHKSPPRENSQMFSLPGEIITNNEEHKKTHFECTLTSEGVCFHRGLSTDLSRLRDIDNSYSRTNLLSPKKKNEPKRDEVIFNNDRFIVITNHRLNMIIVLYKNWKEDKNFFEAMTMKSRMPLSKPSFMR